MVFAEVVVRGGCQSSELVARRCSEYATEVTCVKLVVGVGGAKVVIGVYCTELLVRRWSCRVVVRGGC